MAGIGLIPFCGSAACEVFPGERDGNAHHGTRETTFLAENGVQRVARYVVQGKRLVDLVIVQHLRVQHGF